MWGVSLKRVFMKAVVQESAESFDCSSSNSSKTLFKKLELKSRSAQGTSIFKLTK